jgi:putative proteasome-type protease
MTYCLGIVLPGGLVLASDSRSNAGVDRVAHVCKQSLIVEPGKRVIAILSAGNLATTQSVVTQLRQAAGSGRDGEDLFAAKTFFEAVRIVGDTLRKLMERDAKYVEPYGDATASFIVGGQLADEPPRLFQVYSAGNFVEADERSYFLQIGETKYGKPILDRALTADCGLDEAAKLALLSFDATMRSNLSVGPPIDLLRYHKDSFSTADRVVYGDDHPYWTELKAKYGQGLSALIGELPQPAPGVA